MNKKTLITLLLSSILSSQSFAYDDALLQITNFHTNQNNTLDEFVEQLYQQPQTYTTPTYQYVPQPKSYVVFNYNTGEILDYKNQHMILPIASVTKLMTAHIFLKLNHNQSCITQITNEDNDNIKGTRTRLPKYTNLTCHDLLKAMLVGSDNYAASALSRSAYGYNKQQFIQEMNKQAQLWGMYNTKFYDVAGLNHNNTSTVADLLILSTKVASNPIISTISGSSHTEAYSPYQKVAYNNTNKIIRNGSYPALLSKTGYIRESGYNLVFLNSKRCYKGYIGVISLNNSSSDNRAKFTMSKLLENGCY